LRFFQGLEFLLQFSHVLLSRLNPLEDFIFPSDLIAGTMIMMVRVSRSFRKPSPLVRYTGSLPIKQRLIGTGLLGNLYFAHFRYVKLT